MRKCNLYVMGFAVAFGGGIFAMEQVGDQFLAGHYRALATNYTAKAQPVSASTGTVPFFEQQAAGATARSEFYASVAPDKVAGAFDLLLTNKVPNPMGYMPQHMGYGMGYVPPTEAPLLQFFGGVKDRRTAGIREDQNMRLLFTGGEILRSPNGTQLRAALMDLVSYVATRIPGAPTVTSEVADLELFLNGAVLPFLCRTANTACEYYRSAQIDEEMQRRKALETDGGCGMGVTPAATQAIVAVDLAQREQGVLKALVVKIEEVVDALRRSGRMS